MIMVCYDIGHDSLRTRVGQYLLRIGLERVNRSVYLGSCTDTQRKHLDAFLGRAMAKAGPNDSLLVLPVTERAVWSMAVFGRNDFDLPTITGDRHTLIL